MAVILRHDTEKGYPEEQFVAYVAGKETTSVLKDTILRELKPLNPNINRGIGGR
jgi:hypothetical protein